MAYTLWSVIIMVSVCISKAQKTMLNYDLENRKKYVINKIKTFQ
jgi:hypothetical protein